MGFFRAELCAKAQRPEREEKMLEPQENGLVDLPDYEQTEGETFPAPPPASPEREDGEGAEPQEESGRGSACSRIRRDS